MQKMPEWRTVGTVVRAEAINEQIIVTIALDKDDVGLAAAEVNSDATIGDFRLGGPLGVQVAPRFNGHQIRGYVEIVVYGDGWTRGVAEANASRFVDQLFRVPRRA